ncbi:hypothetical protein DFO62_10185 [Serratia fonticola]|nr:hypothetical protein DFO62_10185 [Serratia fonticola]
MGEWIAIMLLLAALAILSSVFFINAFLNY